MHTATVTIDSSLVSADLSDFVVYIDLSDLPASFWDVVTASGGDIRCYKSDGTTELAREVVSCDTATDTGELHVKYAGTLSSSSDTEIQIHADGTSSDYAVTATYGRNNVWPSSYKTVLHQNEASGSVLVDSTVNGKDATMVGNLPTPTAAKIAKGQLYDGTGDYAELENTYGASFFDNDFTFSVWVEGNDYATAALGVVSFLGEKNIYFRNRGSGSQLAFNMYTGSSNWLYTGALTTNTFYHFVIVRDKSAGVKLYQDGVLQSSNSFTSNANSSSKQNSVGSVGYGGTYPWNGVIDEFRLLNATRSANWISTEYNNQNSPSTFYSVTAEGGGGGGTNMQVNVSDSWKTVDAVKLNVGDVWYGVTSIKQNVGGVWETVF